MARQKSPSSPAFFKSVPQLPIASLLQLVKSLEELAGLKTEWLEKQQQWLFQQTASTTYLQKVQSKIEAIAANQKSHPLKTSGKLASYHSEAQKTQEQLTLINNTLEQIETNIKLIDSKMSDAKAISTSYKP